MLPDLRIVIVAVLSTFVLTVGVGFYTSSRLINEPKKRADSLAALEQSPVNRIALSWPEPVRQSEPLALDFAVTARALRNPVRDVTSEPVAIDPQPQPKELPRTIAAAPAARVVDDAPAKDEVAPATSEAPAPEPDIRIAVQYPPVPDLPPELRAPSAPAVATEPSPPATPAQVVATPATTGSIAPTASNEEPRAVVPQPDRNAPEPTIASLPDPADAKTADDPKLRQSDAAKPTPKAARKKAAPKAAAKKAAPAKTAKRPARRAAPRAAAVPRLDSNFPMNFFGLSTN